MTEATIKNPLGREIKITESTVIEYCTGCQREQRIECTFDVIQKCPECGASIVPCTLCSTGETNCWECAKIMYGGHNN